MSNTGINLLERKSPELWGWMVCLLPYVRGSLHEDVTHLAQGSHGTADQDMDYQACPTSYSKNIPFSTTHFLAFLLLLLWLFTMQLPASAGLRVMGGDATKIRIRVLSWTPPLDPNSLLRYCDFKTRRGNLPVQAVHKLVTTDDCQRFHLQASPASGQQLWEFLTCAVPVVMHPFTHQDLPLMVTGLGCND